MPEPWELWDAAEKPAAVPPSSLAGLVLQAPPGQPCTGC